MTAQQGHLYKYWNGREVIALESGDGMIEVRDVRPDEPSGLGKKYTVDSRFLEPQPMKYFSGQMP